MSENNSKGTGQLKLPPCPFCEGPPSPTVANGLYPYGAADLQPEYGDDGLIVDAYVFCHECGAAGPKHEETIFDAAGYYAADGEGVRLWIERTNKNRGLYDSGAPEGLNLYPRGE